MLSSDTSSSYIARATISDGSVAWVYKIVSPNAFTIRSYESATENVLVMATLSSGVVFGRMQLSTDGTTVTQTDSFKDTTAFNQVADLLIESPTRVHALFCVTFNGASGHTVLAAADFSALSISYTQTLP